MNSANFWNASQSKNEIQTSFTLELRGMGLPSSFKNRKIISRNRKNGKPFLRTKEEVKAWMELAIDQFASQLRSISRTTGDGTPTECWRRFSIAWSALSDDSIKNMPQGSWTTIRVPHGCEGVTITLELI